MKYALLLYLAVTVSAAEIPAGTHLLLRMEHSVSSRTAKVGDGVHLRTSIPIGAGGRIVVPAGSYAQGVVSEVHRGRHAKLRIQLESLTLPSGEVLQVTSNASSAELAPSRTPDSAFGVYSLLGLSAAGVLAGGQIGARAGLGAGAAMILVSAISHHRRDVELRQGAAVDVVLEGPAPAAH